MAFVANSGLSRVTTGVALLVALATVITIPALYFFTAWSYESARLRLEARHVAGLVSKYAYGQPDHWRFNSHRLEELLDRSAGGLDRSQRRIVDKAGIEVAAFGDEPGFPALGSTYAFQDQGAFGGAIEIAESMVPVLVRTGGAALIGLALGLAVFVALRTLPLRALSRVVADLERSQAELQAANEAVGRLNEDLEERIDERTAALRAAQDELLRNERLATLGQLTGTVSHELRNPLAAIRNSVFLLGEKIEGKGLGVERLLERTERNVGRCNRIVSELLDYTRTKSLQLKSATLDLWLKEVLEEQKVPQRIRVSQEMQAPSLKLGFDPDRLRRAVINVFDNACQAMTEAAKVADPGGEQLLTVRTRACDDRAEMCFIDSGLGMTPEVLEKIFEPLYSTKGFGVGLGMPTVKQIMEQHGGGIEISSEPGQGTTVVLWLPRDSAKQAEEEAA